MYNNAEKIKNSQLRKEDWQAFIEPDYAVLKQGESFPEILSRYIGETQKFHNIRQKDISNTTGIESSLITKYKHNRQKPKLYSVILLSLAIKLGRTEKNPLFTFCKSTKDFGYRISSSVHLNKFILFDLNVLAHTQI